MLFENKNLIIVILFIFLTVSITGYCINYQTYVIEGLANSNRNKVNKDYYSDLEEELKNMNDEKNDTLLVDKYKKDYEKLLIESYKNTQLQLLDNITQYNNALIKGNKKDIDNALNKIMKYNSLINSINSSMKYLNTHH
mgnify:CR=1 FL=1|tara:strand:- start:180 stop:596 length:417 start_codon:yes stop_codon:yes gene_type:complete